MIIFFISVDAVPHWLRMAERLKIVMKIRVMIIIKSLFFFMSNFLYAIKTITILSRPESI